MLVDTKTAVCKRCGHPSKFHSARWDRCAGYCKDKSPCKCKGNVR